MKRRDLLVASVAALVMLAPPWTAGIAADHPLDGRIWNTHNRRFIDAGEAYRQASAARHLLLGERHDSAEHHRLQLDMLRAVSERGRFPALAMEQFDREHQPALDAAREAGITDAEALADAGRLNRTGWRWPMYKALIGHAAEQGWPIVAANLSRAEAREIVLGQRTVSLPPAGGTQIAALEADIVNGHCGQRPPPEPLARFVAAQRARDLAMAHAIEAAPGDGTVLIAGAGHVRRDRAVPRYLGTPDSVLTIAYVETRPDKNAPADYDAEGFDLLWFTPPTARPDPCARPLGGIVSTGTGKP